MKKIIVLMMVAILAVAFVGCSNNGNAINNGGIIAEDTNNVEESTDNTEESTEDSEVVEESMSLEEIIDKMYEMSGLEFPRTMKSELTSENMLYMLGVDNFDYIEGLASEPMMTSQAHSVVLFTVEDGADIETIKSDIKANVDGRKWICVGVEDENIVVENAGNYILLIMDDNSEALLEAFNNIMQ